MIEAHAKIDFSAPAMKEWRKLPEEIRAEVVNGKLYILSQPTLYHARVNTRIGFRLMDHVVENNLGEVFMCNVGIFLKSATEVVAPDVVYLSNQNSSILDRKGVFGSPDLIIEILSPSTQRHDRVIKKQLYEAVGVKEYWLVDPVSKETWGYLRENDVYDEPLTMNGELHIRILNKTITF